MRLMARPRPQPTSSTRMPLLQALDQAGHQGQDVLAQHGQDGLPAVLGHDLVEAPEALVGHAAAVAEAGDNVVLDACRAARCTGPERRDVGRRRRPGQPGRVLGRQAVGAGVRVVLDDPRRQHGAEPLAHVALVQAGARTRSARSWPAASRPWRRTGRCGGRSRSSGRARRRSVCPPGAPRTLPSFASSSAAGAVMASSLSIRAFYTRGVRTSSEEAEAAAASYVRRYQLSATESLEIAHPVLLEQRHQRVACLAAVGACCRLGGMRDPPVGSRR